MKMTRVALVLCCVMIVYGVARAQDNSQAPQVLDDLKLQLIDVQAKQGAVRLRRERAVKLSQLEL